MCFGLNGGGGLGFRVSVRDPRGQHGQSLHHLHETSFNSRIFGLMSTAGASFSQVSVVHHLQTLQA